MRKTNRAYKRGEPHRDATLFVIACEGSVREREYFELLGKYTSRIQIKVLENKNGNSAPQWVLDSAARYVTEIGLSDADQLWFVIDVDRWPERQLRTIYEACEANFNWFLVLSNPSFEVWLFMHLDDIQNSTSNCSQDLKNELAQKITGGYNKKTFVPMMRIAHERSRRLDNDEHFFPSIMRTKMHLLTGAILEIIGNNSSI